MAGLIFAGLLASVFFTIKYLEVNHNQRSREDLSLKINEVVNQLQNEPHLEHKLAGNESVILLTAEVSDIHKVEANIFNSQGVLLASSKPEIYAKSLFSNMMEPEAFYQMNVEQLSQLIHRENLRGFDYLSAYLPLFNEKHRIIGYINLPYFIGQSKLNEEISTYTITFVNLYLLLFALALALAYFVSKRITRPLKIIQEKISTTALGTENETIEWKGSDEIGQLIKQYNKMVLELEASADKLTASEREGAWKEMARQVAHEIKNPLTPMKLNIQHLQRAWKDDHPKLEETFKKVTRVLVDQIDSLTRLANEFSNFAQMPIDEFHDYNINQLLLDTISLFERSEDVKFIYDKNELTYRVHGDKGQMGRAFNNLIKNAIQAIPQDRPGIIVVEVTDLKGRLEISIKDNGSGIPKDVGEQIFVPRFSTKNSGMGLGLAITKKVIENNGGTISFTSEVNKGTQFTIIMPLIV
jgi:signal transduction histidine kinase